MCLATSLRRAAPLLVLLLATALPSPARSAAPLSPCGQPGRHTLTLQLGGRTRTALLLVPRRAATAPLPLVIGLHGAAGNGPRFADYSGLAAEADSDDFIGLFPTAAGTRPMWNISRRPQGADDVGFVAALIDQLVASGCADRARVFVTGISNGGGMAALLGCALADRLTAVAPVAGGYGSLPPCAPVRPVSILEIHGTRDRVVPYAGFEPLRAGSVPKLLVFWAARDGCATTPRRRRVAPHTVDARWVHCRPGSRVQGMKIYGGRHQWPGAHPPDLGPSSFDAAKTIWHFFATTRPAV